MDKRMQHRGYIGSVEFSEKDGIYFGKVQDIRSLISYEGKDTEELSNNFQTAVDDYCDVCERN